MTKTDIMETTDLAEEVTSKLRDIIPFRRLW